jgi:hypothetical protein
MKRRFLASFSPRVELDADERFDIEYRPGSSNKENGKTLRVDRAAPYYRGRIRVMGVLLRANGSEGQAVRHVIVDFDTLPGHVREALMILALDHEEIQKFIADREEN